jgi:cytidylate kinase
MQIALSGVPGSGKSDLAKKLKKELESRNIYKNIDIVDGYPEEIEETTDLAIGFPSTYIGNVHVALGREARERISRENNDFSIVCGTIFETSAYTAQFMEREFEIALDEADKYDWQIRVDAVMRYIACLYVDTVQYDKIYHLLPVSAEADIDPYCKTLEKNLQAAFNAFDLFPVKHLGAVGENMEDITEHRVNEIIEDIIDADNVEKQDVQAEKSNGSGV